LVDLGLNENFFGSSIYNEGSPFGAPKPESSMARRTTPEHYKGLATWMNEITGGSQYRTGAIDFNPDALSYFINQQGGSAAGFWFTKLPDFATRVTAGAEVEARGTPFLRKLSGRVTQYKDREKFYGYRDEIEQIYREAKTLDGSDLTKFRAEFGGKLDLRKDLKAVEKQLKALRKRRDLIYGQSLGIRVESQRIGFIDDRMKAVIDKFAIKYKAVE